MLSICVNVKNGERYLKRTLSSLVKFDDVVLVDNFSTDNTLEIAKQFSNVRIFQCEFQGMGKVRNIAASHAKHDWLLFVDCDELLETSLVDCLLNYQFIRGNIYNIYRKNYYDGYLLESSAWGNDWIKRLYNRCDTSFAENQVHDNFIHKLPNIKIKDGAMVHFPYENVSQLIDKMQFYSTLYAKQHFGKKFPKLWLLPFRAVFMFIKCYIIKQGIKDGYEGLTVSMANAVGVWNKYLKLYELYYKKKFAVIFKVENNQEITDILHGINQQLLLPEKVILVKKSSSEDQPRIISGCITSCELIHSDNIEQSASALLASELSDFDALIYCTDPAKLDHPRYVLNLRKSLRNKKNYSGSIVYTKN